MPKIVVSTPELNPNSSWYTRYSGEGTPDAASMRTRRTATDQKAAQAFKREQIRRERERAKEDAACLKERERRQQAIDKAQNALDAARRKHEEKAADIQGELEAVEEKARAEEARWAKEKSTLESALGRARA